MPLISFPHLIEMAKTLGMLSNHGESTRPYLVHNLKDKTFTLSLLSANLSVDLW